MDFLIGLFGGLAGALVGYAGNRQTLSRQQRSSEDDRKRVLYTELLRYCREIQSTFVNEFDDVVFPTVEQFEADLRAKGPGADLSEQRAIIENLEKSAAQVKQQTAILRNWLDNFDRLNFSVRSEGSDKVRDAFRIFCNSLINVRQEGPEVPGEVKAAWKHLTDEMVDDLRPKHR